MFGRRWSFGSDDLAIPTTVLALLHAAWYVAVRLCGKYTVVIIIIIIIIIEETNCTAQWLKWSCEAGGFT